jgi:mono/diheme cytochrome c family protein
MLPPEDPGYNRRRSGSGREKELSMRWKATLIITGISLLGLAAGYHTGSAQQGGDSERGGELYVQYCAACHGLDGQGRIGASLDSFPGIQVDSALTATISGGVPGSVMPAWSSMKGGPLSDSQIADIAAYVVAVFDGTEPVMPAPAYTPPAIPTLPDVEGDPSAGALVYHENCAACHGEGGEGAFGYVLAKNWPANDPAAYIRTVATNGINGTTMPAWGVQQGGPLSDQQIANVAAFVLTLQPQAVGEQPEPTGPGPLGVTASLLLLGVIVVVVSVALVRYYRRA